MSDQHLFQKMQQSFPESPALHDPRWLASRVIAADRWRVRLIATVTTLLWIGGIAGVTYMVFCFNRFIIAYSPTNLATVDEIRIFQAKMDLHHSLNWSLVSVPALLLAALGTVWLVLSSRRATLNQINLSLTDISAQLRNLRPS